MRGLLEVSSSPGHRATCCVFGRRVIARGFPREGSGTPRGCRAPSIEALLVAPRAGGMSGSGEWGESERTLSRWSPGGRSPGGTSLRVSRGGRRGASASDLRAGESTRRRSGRASGRTGKTSTRGGSGSPRTTVDPREDPRVFRAEQVRAVSGGSRYHDRRFRLGTTPSAHPRDGRSVEEEIPEEHCSDSRREPTDREPPAPRSRRPRSMSFDGPFDRDRAGSARTVRTWDRCPPPPA